MSPPKFESPVMLPSGVGEACHESAAYRVAGGCHDDGNRGGRFLRCADRRRCDRDDDVHFQLYQLCRQRRQSFELAVGRAPLDDQVLALDIAEGTHPFQECGGIARTERPAVQRQKAHVPDLAWLLSERRWRPGRGG